MDPGKGQLGTERTELEGKNRKAERVGGKHQGGGRHGGPDKERGEREGRQGEREEETQSEIRDSEER